MKLTFKKQAFQIEGGGKTSPQKKEKKKKKKEDPTSNSAKGQQGKWRFVCREFQNLHGFSRDVRWVMNDQLEKSRQKL